MEHLPLFPVLILYFLTAITVLQIINLIRIGGRPEYFGPPLPPDGLEVGVSKKTGTCLRCRAEKEVTLFAKNDPVYSLFGSTVWVCDGCRGSAVREHPRPS